MRVTKVLRFMPLVAIAFASLVLCTSACGGDTPADNAAISTTTTDPTPVIIPPVITGRNALIDGEPDFPGSIASLLNVYPNVVVGRVEDVLQHFDPRPGFLGLSESQLAELQTGPKGAPIPSDMLARPPGSGTSIYAVRVLANVVGGEPRTNGMFALLQPGGVFENVAYENGGDPVVLPGSTYILFLKAFQNSNYHLPDGYENLPEEYQGLYISSAEARLLVVDGRLEAPGPAWGEVCRHCEGATLIGLSLYEAITLIRQTDLSAEASTRIAGNAP